MRLTNICAQKRGKIGKRKKKKRKIKQTKKYISVCKKTSERFRKTPCGRSGWWWHRVGERGVGGDSRK